MFEGNCDVKLVQAQVTNYRNIIDSDEVEIGQTTCLVGKNEAGKTAFLKAIEGLRSVDDAFKEYGKTENYPRRYLADYGERHGDDEATVVATVWEMDDKDVAAIEAELGTGVVTNRKVTISKTYESTTTTWSVPVDQAKTLASLVARYNLGADDRVALGSSQSTLQAATALEAIGERTESQTELLTAIKKFRKNDAQLRAIDILSARTPRFLYFSHYDRMSGEIAITSSPGTSKARLV